MSAMTQKEYLAADLRGPLNVWVSSGPSGMNSSGWTPYHPSGFGQNDPIYPAQPSGTGGVGGGASKVVSTLGRQICVLSVASGVSQQIDLMASGNFGDDKYFGKFVRIVSETAGNFHYSWFQASGGVIDRTATLPGSGTGACAYVQSTDRIDEMPAGRYFVVQPQNTGIIRIWITNRVGGHGAPF